MSVNNNLRLNGLNPLSYQGVNPYTPVPLFISNRAPTVNDWQNFSIATFWLDSVDQVFYALMNLSRPNATTVLANWVPFVSSVGNLSGLMGNSGGFVAGTGIPPYINVVGDGTTINIVGNPATHTLTASVVGTGVLSSLTGDTGTAVPTAGNIKIWANNATLGSGSTVEFTGSTSNILLTVSDSSNNTIVGNSSGRLLMTGTNNQAFGQSNLTSITSGSFNCAIGNGVLDSLTAGNNNTFVGCGAPGGHITLASDNTGVGYGVLAANTSGSLNCFMGSGAGAANTSGAGNTGFGYGVLSASTSSSGNTAFGYLAGSALAATNANNVLINNIGTSGDGNTIRIGTQGNGSGQQNTCYIAGIYNVSVGATNALVVIDNTGKLGTSSMTATTFDGDAGTATPSANVLNVITNVAANNSGATCYFSASGNTLTLNLSKAASGGSPNTLLGINAGNGSETGYQNTGVGEACLHSLSTGLNNTCLGAGTATSITTSSNNVAIGPAALSSMVTNPGANTAIGDRAMQSYSGTTAGNHIFIGSLAGYLMGDASGANIGIGFQTLYQLNTGGRNIALGVAAGQNFTGSESNNILVGSAGVIGDGNTIRIGTQGSGTSQQNTTFIAGIRGATTGNNNAIAVLVDSAGQLGTVSSSIRYKENVKDMDDYSSRVMRLSPATFNFKGSDEISSGLIAEEVADIFPELVAHNAEGQPESVRYHDLSVLLLNELIKMKNRVDDLEEFLEIH